MPAAEGPACPGGGCGPLGESSLVHSQMRPLAGAREGQRTAVLWALRQGPQPQKGGQPILEANAKGCGEEAPGPWPCDVQLGRQVWSEGTEGVQGVLVLGCGGGGSLSPLAEPSGPHVPICSMTSERPHGAPGLAGQCRERWESCLSWTWCLLCHCPSRCVGWSSEVAPT